MDNGIDAVDGDKQPIKNYIEAKLIYFNSKQEIEEEARNKLKREKKLKHQQYLINKLPYYANFPSTRKNLHDLFISIIIILNIITMSLEFYSIPPLRNYLINFYF
ncbi:unnamed protein product [Adineta steineri]|uniref:Uncharacterized protein n=1 Tax=Adineta steineri TaxID=433720 RepID=A0A815FRZ7_9BILA|nr:unnamed protein product [Adineta steineri]CAF3959534.1 unnamed protein product [Adineta steineri]